MACSPVCETRLLSYRGTVDKVIVWVCPPHWALFRSDFGSEGCLLHSLGFRPKRGNQYMCVLGCQGVFLRLLKVVSFIHKNQLRWWALSLHTASGPIWLVWDPLVQTVLQRVEFGSCSLVGKRCPAHLFCYINIFLFCRVLRVKRIL